MNIRELLSGSINYLNIDAEYTIPSNMYHDTAILELSKIKTIGTLTYPTNDNLALELECTGSMKIEDSVSLEPVDYKFSFKINENVLEFLEKEQFTLDIISILWENIVLEIPIRYSEVTDYTKYKGDGWRVISEDEVENSTNNPFKDLLKVKKKE